MANTTQTKRIQQLVIAVTCHLHDFHCKSSSYGTSRQHRVFILQMMQQSAGFIPAELLFFPVHPALLRNKFMVSLESESLQMNTSLHIKIYVSRHSAVITGGKYQLLKGELQSNCQNH